MRGTESTKPACQLPPELTKPGRNGSGRLTPMKHEVTLLVRAQCHACAAARADIARICAELDVGWHTSDVDADPELRAQYGDRVPVILIDGREHGFWAVEEPRLRAALTG
jgi:glutaredoxin